MTGMQATHSSSIEQTLVDHQTSVHHQIVIVGGGTAGITVAAQLQQRDRNLDIAIIEPSDKHYYQPAWTLVGGGDYDIQQTERSEQSVIPVGCQWIQDAVATFMPESNALVTRSGQQIRYDYLVVCPGIQIDWNKIEGLTESLGHNGVCSNYSVDYAPYTWDCIQNFKGGTAIFTVPSTPIKCGGAPQKIMYLADDAWRKSGVRENSQVLFCSALGGIFPVPAYAEPLLKVVARKGINLQFQHNLKAIRGQEAVFDITTAEGVKEGSIEFNLLHVTPPMSSPDFIKNSPLAVQAGATKGWVDVNKDTLQHNRYTNVFGIGDASSLPISKTAAAIRRQAPVLMENLLAVMQARSLGGKYNGYTCCPLITGYGKVIMAEFDYTNQPLSTFPMDPREERYSMWIVKRHVLPWVYWNRMLKGEQFEGEALKIPGWKPS